MHVLHTGIYLRCVCVYAYAYGLEKAFNWIRVSNTRPAGHMCLTREHFVLVAMLFGNLQITNF